MTRPAVSVVIPTFNGRRLLEVCLASVFRCKPSGLEVEVIVADDASTDDTVDWIVRAYPDILLVQLEQNQGFVGAANAGIAAACGDIIQLLNNDTEVSPGWIEAGLAPFCDLDVGSVAPLVRVRSDPTRVDSAGDTYSFVGWPCKRGHGQRTSDWERHPADIVFGASGSSAFYRASALMKVGAYDTSFGSYYEDVDLAFRLRWAGYSCVFAPTCQILHEVSASYDHGKPSLQRRMSKNGEILFWSNLPWPWLIAAAFPHLAFTLVQGCWRLVRGRAKPFWLGKLDALKEFSSWGGRRKFRSDLARSAVSQPHFPLTFSTLADAKNHLKRPKESHGRQSG